MPDMSYTVVLMSLSVTHYLRSRLCESVMATICDTDYLFSCPLFHHSKFQNQHKILA